MFHENMRYIATCLGRVRGKRASYMDMAEFFGVSKMTTFSWTTTKKERQHIPRMPTLRHVVNQVNKKFGWNITVNDIQFSDLSKSWNIENILADNKSEPDIVFARKHNIDEDLMGLAKRLHYERKFVKEMTLNELADKIKQLFPNSTYQISPAHISEIERGVTIDYHINKIRAMATVLGVTVEYLLFGRRHPKAVTIDEENSAIIIPVNPEFFSNKERITEMAAKIKDVVYALYPELTK